MSCTLPAAPRQQRQADPDQDDRSVSFGLGLCRVLGGATGVTLPAPLMVAVRRTAWPGSISLRIRLAVRGSSLHQKRGRRLLVQRRQLHRSRIRPHARHRCAARSRWPSWRTRRGEPATSAAPPSSPPAAAIRLAISCSMPASTFFCQAKRASAAGLAMLAQYSSAAVPLTAAVSGFASAFSGGWACASGWQLATSPAWALATAAAEVHGGGGRLRRLRAPRHRRLPALLRKRHRAGNRKRGARARPARTPRRMAEASGRRPCEDRCHWTTRSACSAPALLIACRMAMMPGGFSPILVETGDQRLQIGAADDREIGALLIDLDLRVRRHHGLAARERAAAGTPCCSRSRARSGCRAPPPPSRSARPCRSRSCRFARR